MIEFFVPGIAKPAGSKRAFINPKTKRAVITDTTLKGGKDWRGDVQAVAVRAMDGQAPFDEPLGLVVVFYMPRPKSHYGSGRNAGVLKESSPTYPTGKPDVTKLLRALEDALTGICWRDDALVVAQRACKFYADDGRTGARVRVLPAPSRSRLQLMLEPTESQGAA